MNIVISQPMYFPWRGIFEQILLSDVFIHYDDVQFPLGRSFISRVQVKTAEGAKWLTVPVKRKGKQTIRDVEIDREQNWKEKHLGTLEREYAKAPYVSEMLEVVREILSQRIDKISALNILAIERISDYFGISANFRLSSEIEAGTTSSQHLLDLVRYFQGNVYVTGHGAYNYLDHELFTENGIEVRYMEYRCLTYPQLNGPFDPYVTILDLMANCGKDGTKFMSTDTVNWKDFRK